MRYASDGQLFPAGSSPAASSGQRKMRPASGPEHAVPLQYSPDTSAGGLVLRSSDTHENSGEHGEPSVYPPICGRTYL